MSDGWSNFSNTEVDAESKFSNHELDVEKAIFELGLGDDSGVYDEVNDEKGRLE